MAAENVRGRGGVGGNIKPKRVLLEGRESGRQHLTKLFRTISLQ